MELKECNYCLAQYEPARGTSQYCSDSCRANKNRKNDTTTRKLNKLLKEKGLPTTIAHGSLTIKFLETGIKQIDEMTGGFPIRRITEIYGMKGVGKTSLITRLFNADAKILYIDTENAIVNPPSNVTQVHEYLLENVSEVVDDALGLDYDMIVVDSVASMVPRAEIEGDTGDAHMGLKARLMGQWMRRINVKLSKSNTALVFINQERDTMNAYGYQKFTPGGHALPYAASLRLELKTVKKDRKEDGHMVTVKVEKSRVCKPHQETRFKLEY